MPRLPPEFEAYVQQKLDGGEFSSRDDLIREALEVYREMDCKQTELRTLIADRIAQADRGEVVPMDLTPLKEELQAELGEHQRSKTLRPRLDPDE